MRGQQLQLVACEEASGTGVLAMAEDVEIHGCGDVLVLVFVAGLGAQFKESTTIEGIGVVVVFRIPEMQGMDVESCTLRDHLAIFEPNVGFCETHLAYYWDMFSKRLANAMLVSRQGAFPNLHIPIGFMRWLSFMTLSSSFNL